MENLGLHLQDVFPQMVHWRRHLHRHPELSFHEHETAKFVCNLLNSWNIETKTGVGGFGVTGLIRGGSPGPTVALRADMDALPIQDEKNCEYSSTVAGVMHACGHDAHTSALLGVAKVLSENRLKLAGNVLLIFQHAEEIAPGGALSMIEDGVLEEVDVIYGVHLWTPFPVGTVHSVAGPVMAAADEFTVTITGKGGHAGLPHQTVDSVVIGSHLTINLQSIVSRNINPIEPAVVSIGSLHAGSNFNVIAETCKLEGTVRTFNEGIRTQIKQRIEEVVEHTCSMFGAGYSLDYKLGYPPVVNHISEVERFFYTAVPLFGQEHVKAAPLIMAGEDFSYYLNRVPGCYMFVGAGNQEKGIIHPHHHPKFDIDEQAILHASKLLLSMTLNYLETIR
jgi:amidohydrolase